MTTVDEAVAPTPLAAFQVRHFGLVWLGGLIFHICRWGVAFLGTYLVNELTGSPRLVQLAGTTLYAPLLVGGLLGGLISDRFDRLRMVRGQMFVMAPVTALIGFLVRTDRIELWMLYLYLFAMGFAWVGDMTSRRALVFDLVGEARLDNAMAMEALSLSLGMIFGALVGGYAVGAVGIGASYFFIAALALLAVIVLAPVESPQARSRSVKPETSDVPGLASLLANRALISILGVTVIANFFLFSYFPIIPVVAKRLGASPFMVGLLAAGTGIGMMTGSLLVARLNLRRRGVTYLCGLVVALCLVIPFSLANHYWLALAAIICSGIGSGFFGSTQTTLVLATVPEQARGRALGMLSMSIGGLPVGMYALGELAERTSAKVALVCNAIAGLVALAVWLKRRPEVSSL